jgi:hypothetical protein
MAGSSEDFRQTKSSHEKSPKRSEWNNSCVLTAAAAAKFRKGADGDYWTVGQELTEQPALRESARPRGRANYLLFFLALFSWLL